MHSTRLQCLLPLFLPAMLVACGSPLPNKVTGTVQGQSLEAAEASAFTGDQVGAGKAAAEVIIDSETGPFGTSLICSEFKNGQQPMSGILLGLTLMQADAAGVLMPPTPGDYTITFDASPNPAPSTRVATAVFVLLGGQQMPTDDIQASAGTVHISELNLSAGGSVQGTFDLTFGSDHLSGSVNAPFCDAMSPNQSVMTVSSPPPEFDAGVMEMDAGFFEADGG